MQPRGDGRIFPLIDEQLHFLFHRFNEASEAGVFARLLAESRSTTSDGVKLRDFTDSRKLLVKADKLTENWSLTVLIIDYFSYFSNFCCFSFLFIRFVLFSFVLLDSAVFPHLSALYRRND